MALEPGPSLVGDAEVALPAVAGGAMVDVGQLADMLQKVQCPAVTKADAHNTRPSPPHITRDANIFKVCRAGFVLGVVPDGQMESLVKVRHGEVRDGSLRAG